MNTVFHGFGSSFVSIALTFFVFTTLMAYYFYAESSIIFILQHKNRQGTGLEKNVIALLILFPRALAALKDAESGSSLPPSY